jgi:hypothetical protein
LIKRALIPVLLLIAACSAPRTNFMRVIDIDGRVYYADGNKSLISQSGGFIMFTDMITREPIRLKNGTYTAIACAPAEIDRQQQVYMDSLGKPLRAEDLPQEED